MASLTMWSLWVSTVFENIKWCLLYVRMLFWPLLYYLYMENGVKESWLCVICCCILTNTAQNGKSVFRVLNSMFKPILAFSSASKWKIKQHSAFLLYRASEDANGPSNLTSLPYLLDFIDKLCVNIAN